ncbi:FAD-binding protein [Saccharothrix syringae]|uniref:FAD-binding protein n=1 Tax=Saccharothrix syringae TaxID=103733 RepID=UPI000A523AE6|nr:FAD-binding protein [Saccharothrix syringae]
MPDPTPWHPALNQHDLLTTDDAALTEAADDFGRTTTPARPLAVARPTSADDISAILRFATKHDLLMVPQAERHSTAGQAQAPNGIALDMRGLNTIHDITDDRVVVDAGARWSQILDATLPLGAAPPVLTDYLDLSVGGTLSVGGISGATHQHGLQTDNVLELDAVTPDGTRVTCSPTLNPDLFNALRGGKGRHGVIVRATLRLIPAHSHARWFRLRYDHLATFLADQRTLMTEGRFHHLEGQAKPQANGTWTYCIDGVAYFTQPDAPAENRLLTGLADNRDALEANDLTYHGFQNRLADDVALLRTLGPWQHPHPWLNLFLPDHAAEQTLAEILSALGPQDIGESGVVIIYPVPRARISTPQVRLPATPTAFLFSILRAAPPDDPIALRRMLEDNRTLQQQVMSTGGTVYLGEPDR